MSAEELAYAIGAASELEKNLAGHQ
jgi:hypothetical protein